MKFKFFKETLNSSSLYFITVLSITLSVFLNLYLEKTNIEKIENYKTKITKLEDDLSKHKEASKINLELLRLYKENVEFYSKKRRNCE
jgi:hypothetical protein